MLKSAMTAFALLAIAAACGQAGCQAVSAANGTAEAAAEPAPETKRSQENAGTGPRTTGTPETGLEDDPGGNPARGEEMAVTLCADCHAVRGEPVSPVPDAAPFHRLRRMWPLENMEEALAEGIMVGHPTVQMPVFQFTPREISDLLAYIESIEPQNPAAEPAE